MMKKALLTAIFGIISLNTSFAHKDFFRTYRSGSVTSTIKTGYEYEELKKVEIITNLANTLLSEMGVRDSVSLFFDHDYTGSRDSNISASVNHKITLNQNARKFKIHTTLKLLEYLANEFKNDKEFRTVHIENIALNNENSPLLTKLINTKQQRPESPSTQGISYFIQNDQYHFYFKDPVSPPSEVNLILDELFQFERIGRGALIFDTDSTFYCISNITKPTVSTRHKLSGNIRKWKPYKITSLGDHNYAIQYSKKNENDIGIKNNTALYILEYDTLIPNLNTFLRKNVVLPASKLRKDIRSVSF
ncbi:hypothetical protein FUAX_42020 (plasmid) [Fulvitalea axinellae]|uniref:Uncharacterized protein n=1 Tax=Fulvitalea axinellae TaxID=1182444 RepID=A0AAU9DKI9_9BACT|nr:hypothetical protein FUAX_42020 [Fulvitalea axinellae]